MEQNFRIYENADKKLLQLRSEEPELMGDDRVTEYKTTFMEKS